MRVRRCVCGQRRTDNWLHISIKTCLLSGSSLSLQSIPPLKCASSGPCPETVNEMKTRTNSVCRRELVMGDGSWFYLHHLCESDATRHRTWSCVDWRQKCMRILTHTISTVFPSGFPILFHAITNYVLRAQITVFSTAFSSASGRASKAVICALCACPKFLGKTFCDYRQNKYAIMHSSLSATKRTSEKGNAFILCGP